MWVWVWRHCGYLWELIPSRRFPERDGWNPVCPGCGATPVRKWEKV